MKKLLLIFTFILLHSAVFFAQNNTIEGVLVNSNTKKPLSYANIFILNSNKGTTSDDDGYFSIESTDASKVLRFGYVGYHSKDLDFTKKQPDTISLVQNSEQLTEVIIIRPKFKKSIKIKGGKGKNNIGISNTSNGDAPGALLRYFEKPSELGNEPAFLKSAEFYLYRGLENDNRDYIFRIRVMSVAENGKPGYDLIENTTLKGKSGSKISINLEDTAILIPKNGFFIGVEGLQIQQNYIEVQQIISSDGKTRKIKKYGPIFKGVETKNPIYYFGGGEWRKLKMPVPAINLELTN